MTNLLPLSILLAEEAQSWVHRPDKSNLILNITKRLQRSRHLMSIVGTTFRVFMHAKSADRWAFSSNSSTLAWWKRWSETRQTRSKTMLIYLRFYLFFFFLFPICRLLAMIMGNWLNGATWTKRPSIPLKMPPMEERDPLQRTHKRLSFLR